MDIENKSNTNSNNNSNNNEDLSSFKWTLSNIFFSLFLFFFACLCEIGGGYLVWIGRREKKSILIILVGCIILIIYGFIPTFQPTSSFGRLYAVYGGFFIIGSYLWGMYFDDMRIDKGDVLGCCMALIGVCIAFFWPR